MATPITTIRVAEPRDQPQRRGRQDPTHMAYITAESVRKSKFRAARRRLENLPPLRGDEVQDLMFLVLVAGDGGNRNRKR